MEEESKDLMPTMPFLSKSLSHQNPESDTDTDTDTDTDRFKQSLRELKDLRSQLYHAADYCENAFLKTAQKKLLLEKTKNYVCEVIVTVVGTVSSNLEQRVYGNNKISQTEQRIDCLKQRLLTCQQYSFSLDLSSLLWSAKFLSHHRHYVSPLANATPCKKHQSTETAGERMFDTNLIVKPPVTHLTSGTELAAVVPPFDSPSRILKPFNPSLSSPTEDTFKLGCSDLKKKQLQGSNFLSFLRKSKRKI